jgi:murein DD-endopeptidase MepM/ murein hydrolase activator NlpD
MSTPYDGTIALWHWRGSSIAEKTIEEVARTIKQWAPYVKGIWVKTSDGAHWMSHYDNDPPLAISGPQMIARWVQILAANGLEFHAWCVPKGVDIEAETELIIQACNVPGVRSMVLDVEPHAHFWQGGREAIRPFMVRVRRGIGGAFHLGMSVDPRPYHYSRIYPEEWQPFINSVHPQTYWASFQRPVREVIDEVYATWGGYDHPIFPVLQGYVDPGEMSEARDYCVEKYGAEGLSWWRFGVIGPTHFPVINKPLGDVPPPDEEPEPGGYYGPSIIITPDDPRFALGTHTGQPVDQVFNRYTNVWGWNVRYKETEDLRSTVWALWDPQFTESGWYEVSAFVSARNATSTNARYKLYGALNTDNKLELIELDQSQYRNLWVPLGIFQFDANHARAGVVFLNDLTYESDKRIAFDALRFRQILGRDEYGDYFADGYDVPIGINDERRSSEVWPGNWFDATGFAAHYFAGTVHEAYHTGADLNLNIPYWDADAHSPVYAAASGEVTFAGHLVGWGNVIIIRHDPLITNDQVMYGRYAHVKSIRVSPGDRVQRGQQIANVGNAEGIFPYHLHFDLSPSNVLEDAPWDWPRLDLNRLYRDYVDPREFIENNRPTSP